MPKEDYIDPNDEQFGGQLSTYKDLIPGYSADLNVSAGEVTAQAADADYFNYCVQCHTIAQQFAQQWTGWRNLIRHGGKTPLGGAPILPILPDAVPAVAPGVEPRFRALVQANKTEANYTTSLGKALGTEGPEHTRPDLNRVQPEITATHNGADVLVGWGWGGHRAFLHQCEIRVDRGDGHGYVLLTYDTTPNYTDTEPHPASPVKWTYQAIYRVNDRQVGVWSNPVSITVGG